MIQDAKRIPRCGKGQHTHARQLRKLHTFEDETIKIVNKVQRERSWSVLDRAEQRLPKPFIAKEQNSKIAVLEGAANTLWKHFSVL